MYKTASALTGLTGLALMLMSSDMGVATEQGKDRTGSPVGLTARCESCHTGASFSVSIATRLKDNLGNVVTSYIPGDTYTYEVELTSSGAAAYGFESVAILSTNANAGTLNSGGSNNKIKSLTIGGVSRRYAEHTSPSTSGLFQMDWVAPAAGSGNVRFYAAGIGCNNNAAKTGDKATLAPTLTITEDVSAGINDVPQTVFNVYPNPVIDQLNITAPFSGDARLVIVSLDGKTVMNKTQTLVQGEISKQDVTSINPGTYIVYLTDEAGQQTVSTKLVKQ